MGLPAWLLLLLHVCIEAAPVSQLFAIQCATRSTLFCAADIISAVTFDHTGQHLATGDRGGRVVLFERVPTQPVRTSWSSVR